MEAGLLWMEGCKTQNNTQIIVRAIKVALQLKKSKNA
jgi:hypothetical protein